MCQDIQLDLPTSWANDLLANPLNDINDRILHDLTLSKAITSGWTSFSQG